LAHPVYTCITSRAKNAIFTHEHPLRPLSRNMTSACMSALRPKLINVRWSRRGTAI